MTLAKMLRATESKSFEFRLETFNAFNHAQFYGAAAPRLVQIAVKFAF
jgi:hypothetical protein